jgi:hypothetical protein
MGLLLKRGDEIAEIEAASLTGGEHVIDRMLESIPPIAFLQCKEE